MQLTLTFVTSVCFFYVCFLIVAFFKWSFENKFVEQAHWIVFDFLVTTDIHLVAL